MELQNIEMFGNRPQPAIVIVLCNSWQWDYFHCRCHCHCHCYRDLRAVSYVSDVMLAVCQYWFKHSAPVKQAGPEYLPTLTELWPSYCHYPIRNVIGNVRIPVTHKTISNFPDDIFCPKYILGTAGPSSVIQKHFKLFGYWFVWFVDWITAVKSGEAEYQNGARLSICNFVIGYYRVNFLLFHLKALGSVMRWLCHLTVTANKIFEITQKSHDWAIETFSSACHWNHQTNFHNINTMWKLLSYMHWMAKIEIPRTRRKQMT